MTPPQGDGPSLDQYLETRFNLLTTLIDKLESSILVRIEAVERRLGLEIEHAKESADQADKASQTAVNKAELAMAEWKAGHNEFNKRMETVTSNSATRQAFESFTKQYDADKLAIEKRYSEQIGGQTTARLGRETTMGQLALVIAGVSTLVSVLVSVVLAMMNKGG